jgi:two-component system response regulator YesN
MNVLLIDDDPFVLSLLQVVFVKWGYNVRSYLNPGQCPAFCSAACPCDWSGRACPDLVLTDVNMPGVNGISFVEELVRKGCKFHRLGMMSGDWSEPHLRRAVDLGASIFAKPFNIPSLHAWATEEKKRVA